MKKFLAVLGVVVLIIPSILAFVVYKDTLRKESEREILQSVEVTDKEGKVFVFEKESREFEFLKKLAKISESSTSTKDDLVRMSEMSELSKENPKCVRFILKYKTNHKEHGVEVFVTDVDRIGSYVTYLALEDGSVVCFGENEQKELLSFEFTYSVNDAAEIPLLTVSDKEYAPLKAEWKVKNANGEFWNVEVPSGKTEDIGSIGSGYTFSVNPDEISVKVYSESKEELFSGKPEELMSYEATRSGKITIEVHAIWYQKDNKNYAGNATYSFVAQVSADPIFKLNATEVQPGGTLLLSCFNIPEDSITVAAVGEKALPLFRKGSDLYAIVPFSYDTPAGKQSIDIMMGSEIVKLEVTVTAKDFIKTKAISTSQMPADAFAAAANEAAKTEYLALMASVAALESDVLSFSGSLKNYEDNYKLYKGYGLYIPYTSGGGATIRNDGVFFTAKEGSAIEAMDDGKVCAVGITPYLGKYIVIDHGYGLRTWYATLGETNVEVGDSIKRGQIIAKSGSGGIAPKENIIVMVTVGSTPVSPYFFWEGERKFPQ